MPIETKLRLIKSYLNTLQKEAIIAVFIDRLTIDEINNLTAYINTLDKEV